MARDNDSESELCPLCREKSVSESRRQACSEALVYVLAEWNVHAGAVRLEQLLRKAAE